MTKRVIITAIIVALSFLAFFLIGAEQIATPEQTSTQYVAFELDNTSVKCQEACRIGNQPFYLLALACFAHGLAITRQPILLVHTTSSKHTPTQLLKYIERLTRAPNARTA